MTAVESFMQPVPGPGQLPRPARGEVVLWWATTAVTPAALESLRRDLDDETRARANAFVRTEDRHRAIVAHGLLRRVLASMLGPQPSDLELLRHCVSCGANDHGKPSLPLREGGSLPPLQFNLAHSGPVVAVAVAGSPTPVGVDVELVQPDMDWEPTRRHVFSPAEWESSAAASDPLRDRFQQWSRKEAVVKATGHGLAIELSRVYVEHASRVAGAFSEATIAGSSIVDELNVADVRLTPDVVAAVAVTGLPTELTRPPTIVRAEL